MEHPPSPRVTPFPFGGTKRIHSKDRVWIVTDVHAFTDKFHGWSTPQSWYRAGALCLNTNRLVLVEFSNDDVRAMLKAGATVAPWSAPRPYGFEVTRFTHGSQEKGRFRERVDLIELDPELVKHGPQLRAYCERQMALRGNWPAGAWKRMQDAANRENSIEAAALSFTDWFSAGDVKKLVGKGINVTRTLARMVEERLLITNCKAKKGMKYMAAPPVIIDRADWTD